MKKISLIALAIFLNGNTSFSESLENIKSAETKSSVGDFFINTEKDLNKQKELTQEEIKIIEEDTGVNFTQDAESILNDKSLVSKNNNRNGKPWYSHNPYGMKKNNYSFVLDSGHMGAFDDMYLRGVVDFGENFSSMQALTFDGVSELLNDSWLDSILTRFITLNIVGEFNVLFEDMETAQIHEFGHMLGSRRIGKIHSFRSGYGSNFFSFLQENYKMRGETGGQMWDDPLFTYDDFTNTSYYHYKDFDVNGVTLQILDQNPEGAILNTAGGLNTERMLMENLTERNIFYNNANLGNMFTYMQRMKAYDAYDKDFAGGDRHFIAAYYQSKRPNLSKDEIDELIVTAEDNAFMLSASTWAYALGAMNYMFYGDSTVPTPVVSGVRLPDVYQYFNIEGISHKINTGYFVNKNLYLSASYEYLIEDFNGIFGANYTEVDGYIPDYTETNPYSNNYTDITKSNYEDWTLGIKYYMPKSKVELNAEVWVDSEFQMEVSALKELGENFTASMGYKHYNFGTFDGQRTIQSIENGLEGDEVFGSVRLRF